MDKMREMLLQETNYRCGYCMRNITPRRYQFLEKADDDYRLLNVFDRAHLIPHRITQDNYKDFYNLIALCKQCHDEIDSGALDIKTLQQLKLHWLVASGRFTRLEIDILMVLYNARNNKNIMPKYIQNRTFNIKHSMNIDRQRDAFDSCDISRYILFGDSKILYNEIFFDNTDLAVCNITVFSTIHPLIPIYQKIIDLKFVTFLMYQTPSGDLGWFTIHDVNLSSSHICITKEGYNFCQKFHEAYKNLDNLNAQ